jgi:hypothetical protein
MEPLCTAHVARRWCALLELFQDEGIQVMLGTACAASRDDPASTFDYTSRQRAAEK